MVTSLVSSKAPEAIHPRARPIQQPALPGAAERVCSYAISVSMSPKVAWWIWPCRRIGTTEMSRVLLYMTERRGANGEKAAPFHASCSLCIRASVPTRQVLGLPEGRSSKKWQDYSLDGHQIVCHLVSSDYRWAHCFPICCWRCQKSCSARCCRFVSWFS